MGDLAAMLRPGDTLCHPFHGMGNTIIDANGRVKPKVREAHRRGVLFDTADGRRNHSFAVTRAALADDFPPDIISTDIVTVSVFGDMVFGLPVMMSKYLAFGMPLAEVVRACTATPAAALGLAGRIGTLAPGASADVAIFKLKDKQRRLHNLLDETMVVPKLFVPQVTILDGRVVFRQVDFC
jgi:predicted amidohydrolase